MGTRSKRKAKQKKLKTELDAILRRVDRLPDLDARTPDEIIGYDENGLPGPGVTPSSLSVSAPGSGDPAEDLNLEDWREKFGREIPPAVKEFLEYRHREWELGMEADLEERSKMRRHSTASRTIRRDPNR